MNDLNAVVRDLDELSVAYANRVAADGADHQNSAYNRAQSLRFYTAAQAINSAIVAAAARG